MSNDKVIAKVQEILNSELTPDEMSQKIDDILPSGCVRKVTKEEGTSDECLARTGSPYRFRHCVEITNCPDDSDNMPYTCGQWRCG